MGAHGRRRAKTLVSIQENAEYTPRRAIMYCPGDDLRKVNKGLNSGADSIALDCEDGVALSRKVGIYLLGEQLYSSFQ